MFVAHHLSASLSVHTGADRPRYEAARPLWKHVTRRPPAACCVVRIVSAGDSRRAGAVRGGLPARRPDIRGPGPWPGRSGALRDPQPQVAPLDGVVVADLALLLDAQDGAPSAEMVGDKGGAVLSDGD